MVARSRSRARAGSLIVFEGVDGVGKTTLARALTKLLSAKCIPVTRASFPGREPGTLAAHVYRLYHDPGRFSVKTLNHEALQILLTAAHIDVIRTTVGPALRRGEVVVLDRFWWSTWVYGRATGVAPTILERLLGLEMLVWGRLVPTHLFLVTRRYAGHSDAPGVRARRLTNLYHVLARRESLYGRYAISRLVNNGSVVQATEEVLSHLESIGLGVGK